MNVRRMPSRHATLQSCALLSCALLSCALPCSLSAAAAAPATMRLASLEWLPYTGAGLDQGGMATAVAAAVAKQFEYKVKVDYFPWSRAMQVGGEDPGYAGYFPAYYTEERARQCYFSAPMGHSTVGLAFLKSQPLQWHAARDLIGMHIGVVAGYSNGGEFDALVKQGKLRVDASPGDAFNLKKLLAGRVRAVVIDKSVLRYLLLSDPALRRDRGQIVFHDTVLAELSLHICFQRTPAGLKMQQDFDAALQHTDIVKIENAYFLNMENKAGAK